MQRVAPGETHTQSAAGRGHVHRARAPVDDGEDGRAVAGSEGEEEEEEQRDHRPRRH